MLSSWVALSFLSRSLSSPAVALGGILLLSGLLPGQALFVKPVKVLGDPHFIGTAANPTSRDSAGPNVVEGRELSSPEGIALDTSVSPPIAYIADTGNNRVLAFRYATQLTAGSFADLILGQPDRFTTNPGGSGGVSFFDVSWSVSRSIVSGASPATVNIEASQSDFNFPAGGQLTHLESDINGSLVNGTVTGQQFISLTNTLFDLGGTTPGPQGPFNAAFTNSAGVGFTTPAVYAIYENLSISLGADGSSNGEFRSTVGSVIPEPGTVALLCFALSALGFTGRRRERFDLVDLR